MTIKRCFVCEITDEEREILSNAINVLNDEENIRYWKCNCGGSLTSKLEDAISIMQDIVNGKKF